jgi:hexosaminidase
MKSLTSLAGATMLLFLTSCVSEDKTASYISGNLEIKWALEMNTFFPNEKADAEFTFINRGNRKINGSDWKLYFTQQSMQPLVSADSSLGKIEHINGYFYSFSPSVAMVIEPLDSVVFRAAFEGTYIKEAFCPDGLYISAFEGTTNESVFKPAKFTRLPLGTGDKVFPGFNALVATPENIYSKYNKMKLLPEEETGLLIPSPAFLKKTGETLILRENTELVAPGAAVNEAAYFNETLQKLFGVTVTVIDKGDPAPNRIVMKLVSKNLSGSSDESYRLSVSRNGGVLIEASSSKGIFYAIQSLFQLTSFNGEEAFIPCLEIFDFPRFAFRGFMLDIARNFQTKEAVYKLIDLLALYKINSLDIRLTDDEGWRIEIPGLPELTEVGSRRGHTLDASDRLMPAFGSGALPEAECNSGTGYLTRQDYIDIVGYAGRRHIMIIPEICFPSHANAAIRSMEARYRKYSGSGDMDKAEEYRLIDPDDTSKYFSAQMFTGNVACAARESVYRFYGKVIDEIVSMHSDAGYPLSFFHNGGDEVPEGAWSGSPLSIAFAAKEGIEGGTAGLHPYFFRKVLDLTSKHNLKTGGWEEVVLKRGSGEKREVNSEFVNNNVIPFIWDNTGDNADLGYRIANAGYSVVLCCATNLYFDFAYNTDPAEPGHYWAGFQEEKDPFVMAPFNIQYSTVYNDYGYLDPTIERSGKIEKLRAENEKRILGLQAQLWTETVKGMDMMEYYTVPKIFAFAEKAWAPARTWENEANPVKRIHAIDYEWNEFANRIVRRGLPMLDRLNGGYNYRIPSPGAIIENDTLKAVLQLPGLPMRYTTDGSDPGNGSELYTGPVKVMGEAIIRAFSPSGRAGKSVTVKTH